MRSWKRQLAEFFFFPPLKLIAPWFFDRKYLQGRHFEGDGLGWWWVWRGLIFQKVFGFNRTARFPVTHLSTVYHPAQVEFHPDDLNNFQSPGCVYSNAFPSKIILGKGSYIAPNVGFITANHDLNQLERLLPGEDIELGESCWVGMNCVLLPGVKLGPRTVVAAGSVVTKSFSEGQVVIGGVPARVLKALPPLEPLGPAPAAGEGAGPPGGRTTEVGLEGEAQATS